MAQPLSLVGAGRGRFMEQHGSGAEKAVRRDAAGRWMLRLHVDSQVIAVQIHAGRCGPLPELTLRAGQCGSQLQALVDLVPDAATQRESRRDFCRASRVALLRRAVPSTVGWQSRYVTLTRRGRRAATRERR